MKNYTLKTLGISTLFVAGFSLLVIGPASPLGAQSRQLPAPRYTPPAAPASRPSQAPASAPRQSAPAPQQRSTPAPQPQSNPAPQQQHAAAPSSQTQTQRPSQPAPVQAHPAQEQARQQKEQQKVQQSQQQEQARQQKQSQKMAQKQEQQKAREQQQQQKLHDKQQKEQEKELARQQKENEKSDKKQAKFASAPHSSSVVASSTRSTATSSGNSTMVGSKTATGGSGDVINRLNASRSGMKGINSKPLPAGDVAVHQNGSMTLKASGDRQYGLRANGTISSFSANGKSANFDSRGKVTAIHTASMDVRRGANGRRLVVSHRSDNTTVVATSRHNGYVERTFQRENRTYIQRSVVLNSRIVTRTYVVYGYRGVALPHFVSPVFYSPAFYGWAFYPWVAPVGYTWGWFGEPWYLGPHPYFVAYPTYPSASFWLTDYYLGQTLSAAYHEQQDALADGRDDSDLSADDSYAFDQDDLDSLQAPEATPITPALKAAIADEVREQIAAENTAAANPGKATSYGELPSILNKGNYVFVVADELNVTTPDQQGCALQAGDTLQLTTPTSDSSSLVQLRVTSSKMLDCPTGVQVMVSLQDLQDMQNNFRTQIASGLGTLQAKQGTGGLPSAPPEALSIPPQSATGIDSISSAQAVSTLDSETHQADALEQEMTHSAGEAF